MPVKVLLSLTVNGEHAEVAIAPHKTLLEVLREELGLTGTKHGCELGECGACVVLLAQVPGEGEMPAWNPVLSCLTLAIECEGSLVRTIEGLAEGPNLHPLQASFADHGASQCGYCTGAMLLTADALLAKKPDATRDDIKEALSGVLCRCTGYLQIFEAVEDAAGRLRERAVKAEVTGG